MTFKFARTSIDTPVERIMDAFDSAFSDHGGPKDMALFHMRSDDGQAQCYLIPATALDIAPELGLVADWGNIYGPLSPEWGLLVGHVSAWEDHGVPRLER